MNSASDIVKKLAKDLNWNIKQQMEFINWLMQNDVIIATQEIFKNELNKMGYKIVTKTPMHSSKPDVS